MSDPKIRLLNPVYVAPDTTCTCVGRRLMEDGHIPPNQLLFALEKEQAWQTTAPEILSAQGWITPEQKRHALAQHFKAQEVDLEAAPPDSRLRSLLSPEFCLRHAIVPWINLAGMLIYATSRPHNFTKIRETLPQGETGTMLAVATEEQVMSSVENAHRTDLTWATETRVNETLSCRTWDKRPLTRVGLCLAFLSLIVAFASLNLTYAYLTLTGFAVGSQILSAAMKCTALLASRRANVAITHVPPPDDKLPKISVLVPLYKEKDIANALLRRLSKLTYPKPLLDVVLVLEQQDQLTKDVIAQTDLPRWMSVIEVPASSGLTTKPRALNYALDFCKGDIIGIWDAEDAPAPDQLEQVAQHFATAAPDVACLQGILDYYNPYTNWLSRCFTLEYSMWFRVILRGMSYLGAAIPLGGTTLFIKRDVIEEVGRWDAHNVTEDADLGIRLNRYGHRTELLRTVTQEEANCRLRPWIKQRSRWLKGYMVTYLVHMRRPRILLKELGLRKFIGFNFIFLTTLTQFLLAPIIWSFWLLIFGITMPWVGALPLEMQYAITALFICVSTLEAIIAAISVRGQNRRKLVVWVITLPIYFALATFGAYKALYELITDPFYWDKTAHGKTAEGQLAEYSAIST